MRLTANLFFLIFEMLAFGSVKPAEASEHKAQELTPKVLTILHTNDIHGHILPWTGWEGEMSGKSIGGFARLATEVKLVRETVPSNSILLVDAGDTLGDSLESIVSKGGFILELMDLLHYDAISPGNHDYDFGSAHLRKFADQHQVKFLATNLFSQGSGKTVFNGSRIFERAGLKIGILGLTYPNTALTTTAKNLKDLVFSQETARLVKSEVQKLRSSGAVVIVVLSHLGLTADMQLASETDDVDVIIGGHSHNRMTIPEKVGRTLIVQAGAHGSDLGELTLKVGSNSNIEASYKLIELSENIEPDAEIAALINKQILKKGVGKTRLGNAEKTLIRPQTLAKAIPEKRKLQSDADSFFADVLRESLNSEIVLLPGVGYGIALQPGAISELNLRNLIPHDAKMISMKLSGQQIKNILEQSVENVFSKPPQKVGGMIQVSGLSFSYNSEKKFGERVSDLKVSGEKAVLEQLYRVSTNEMLARGGHRYSDFLNGSDQKTSSKTQYQLIAQFLKRKKEIRPPSDVRITEILNP